MKSYKTNYLHFRRICKHHQNKQSVGFQLRLKYFVLTFPIQVLFVLNGWNRYMEIQSHSIVNGICVYFPIGCSFCGFIGFLAICFVIFVMWISSTIVFGCTVEKLILVDKTKQKIDMLQCWIDLECICSSLILIKFSVVYWTNTPVLHRRHHHQTKDNFDAMQLHVQWSSTLNHKISRG